MTCGCCGARRRGCGGADLIEACGQPASYLAFQPILAWDLGKNVGDVGWDPASDVKSGAPIVLYQIQGVSGWIAQPLHYPAVRAAACERLRRR